MKEDMLSEDHENLIDLCAITELLRNISTLKLQMLASLAVLGSFIQPVSGRPDCRFGVDYSCADFANPLVVEEYLSHVMKWEGQFAQPGIGYDAVSGYTYDGHPLNYADGTLYGEPHLFSAPSKESIHVCCFI